MEILVFLRVGFDWHALLYFIMIIIYSCRWSCWFSCPGYWVHWQSTSNYDIWWRLQKGRFVFCNFCSTEIVWLCKLCYNVITTIVDLKLLKKACIWLLKSILCKPMLIAQLIPCIWSESDCHWYHCIILNLM